MSVDSEYSTNYVNNVMNSIRTYQRLLRERKEHSESISKLKLCGCKGQLASNLISFAMSGTWSVSIQNCVFNSIQYKIPIICMKNVLTLLVETRKRVQNMIKTKVDKSEIEETIKAFQIYKLNAQEDFMNRFPQDYDYMKEWAYASSWYELAKNPFKNHEKWTFFFTNTEKINIDRLIQDIEIILSIHEKFLIIEKLELTATQLAKEVKSESVMILANSGLKRKFKKISSNETEEENETFEDMLINYKKLIKK